jgi:hypothetical protein
MQLDPSLPPEPLPLTEASVQEIQLELIRRKQFNFFDGRKIVASLQQHRSLWRAVLMDRTGGFDLIKLRDLPDNCSNVDELFIMTDTYSQAYELQRIAEDEQWQADTTQLIESESARSSALGTSQPGFIVSFWWD